MGMGDVDMEVKRMEKIIRYVCKDCGRMHESEYKCVACEDSHKHPVSVSQRKKHHYTYPEEVEVLMSDGKTKRYKWDSTWNGHP